MVLPLVAGLGKGLLGGGAKKAAAAKMGAKGGRSAGKRMAAKITSSEDRDPTPTTPQTAPAPTTTPSTPSPKAAASPLLRKTGLIRIDAALQNVSKSIGRVKGNFQTSKEYDKELDDKKKQARVRRTRQKQERRLEVPAIITGMISGIVGATTPIMDRVKNFFLQILIGSIVLWFKKNIEKVTKALEDFAADFQEKFDFVNEKFIQPLWNIAKAIVGPVVDLVAKFVGTPDYEGEANKISKQLNDILMEIPVFNDYVKKAQDIVEKMKINIPEDTLQQGIEQAQGRQAPPAPSQRPPSSRPSTGTTGGGGSTPPPVGSTTPAPESQPSTSGSRGSSSGLSPNAQALLDTIAYAEGTSGPRGYDTWFGGRTDMDISSMTINDVVAEQKRRLANGEASYGGYTSAAVGRYQMMEPEVFAVKAGLDPAKDIFSPANQDKMAIAGYMKGQARLTDEEINGPITRELIAKIAPVWASLPMMNGRSRYNQPVKRYETLVKIYEQKLKEAEAPQSSVAPPSARPAAVTPRTPMMGEAYKTGLKTGASQHIGGSSDYHVDTKFPADLPIEKAVAMVDQMSREYAKQGREIEFSNSAVAGLVYDHNAPYADRLALLKRVFGAHAPRGGWRSMDYYIPLKSDAQGRFGSSAEGAEIVTPTIQGGKIEYHSGGRYGAFVVVVDENGKVVSKTGHGDIRGARDGLVIDIPKGTNNQSGGISRQASYDRRAPTVVVTPPPSSPGASGMMSGPKRTPSNPPTQGSVNNSWWSKLSNIRLF